MKKRIFLICLILIMTTMLGFAEKRKDMIIVDNTNRFVFNENAINYRSLAYASTDFFKKAFGTEVKIDKDKITLTKDDIKIEAKIGSSMYFRNEEKISIKETILKKNDKIYLPLKPFVYFLNYEIKADWNSNTSSIDYFLNKSEKEELWKNIEVKSKNVLGHISPDKKWIAWSQEYYDKNEKGHDIRYYVTYLQNVDTEEIKEIYSSESLVTCYLLWTKDNELIRGGVKNIFGGKDKRHLAIYNPITQKSTYLMDMGKGAGFRYVPDKNALVYGIVKDPLDDKSIVYKIFYLDTKKTQNITKDIYIALSRTE